MGVPKAVTVALLLAIFASCEARVGGSVNNGTIYIGSTATKEFFATESSEWDFLRGAFTCGDNGFNLGKLASFETPEELDIIDKWFLQTTGEFGGVPFWTSGSAGLGGSCGTEWTGTGNPIESSITASWQPGGGGSPMYLWYRCVTIERTCFSWSAGSPCRWEGGHAYRTQLVWRDCTSSYRYICQRNLV